MFSHDNGPLFGSEFIKNNERAAIAVNGVRYRPMLADWVFAEIKTDHMDNIWYEQEKPKH